MEYGRDRATNQQPASKMTEPQDQEVSVELPAELEVGVYANFALVSSGPHDFVIDFCQIRTQPPEGDAPAVRVVSRIRIAPTFVGPLLQAISQNAFNRDEMIEKAQKGGDVDES